jgi:mono/diheme cytochrome c family protein
MLLGLTGGETVLLVMGLVFIGFALVVSMLIPRYRPDFPGDRLGLFVFVSFLLFLAMATAVVTTAGGEEHGAAETGHAETETGPTETETGPTETETGPTETETGPTETETGPTETETEPTETETEPTETETEPTATETEPTETGAGGGDAAAGEEVFASAGCETCHTLAVAGSTGNVGPNLDEAQPSADLVIERVTEGKGAMPAFADQLSEQQIRDVAAYVSENAGRE